MDLRSTISLVADGGSGIWFALTRNLVALENPVIIFERDAYTLGRAARSTGARTAADDATRTNAQERFLSFLQNHHGRPNLLVNNADKFRPHDFKSAPNTLQKTKSEIAINAAAPLTPKKMPADPVRDNYLGLRGTGTAMGLGQSRQIGFLGRILPDFLIRRFAKN